MEAFLIKLGLQVVLKFYQKNPWAILPTLLCLAMPVILVASMLSAGAAGIQSALNTQVVSCSSSYQEGVNDIFKNVDANDKNAQLAKSSLTSTCPPSGTSAGYMYDTTIWQQVVALAQADEKAGVGWDLGKVNALLELALSGTGKGLPADEQKTFQDQVKADFTKMENDHRGDASIYKAIEDYAQEKVTLSLTIAGSSGGVNAMIAAARSKIGFDYQMTGSWNAAKGCYYGEVYQGKVQCGFNCDELVAYAMAVSKGVSVSGATIPAPYENQSVDPQYANFVKLGAQPIDASQRQPGDLIYIRGDSDGSFSHVAIYSGVKVVNGVSTDMYIEAPDYGKGGVRERDAWWTGTPVQYLRVAGTSLIGSDTTGGSATLVNGTSDADSDNSPAAMAAKSYAKSLLPQYGWNDAAGQQYLCLVNLWHHESNWNYAAENPSSGAYGIPQALPGSKMATVGSDWRSNYKTQVIWGLNYIKKYGNPCGAWTFETSHVPNWY